MRRWFERCRTIRKRYRYEQSASVRSRKYQMLWSNIEILKDAVYEQPPEPVVRRRFSDRDPVAREASEILERALDTTMDLSDFDSVFKQVRDDYLLYARGMARVYYQPEFELANSGEETIGDALSIEGQPPEEDGLVEEPSLAFEHVKVRYVGRSDFRHQPARVWDEVDWVAFRGFMSRSEVTERFGPEIGAAIALGDEPMSREESEGEGASGQVQRQLVKKAEVWEIWDRAHNIVLWISPGYPEVLEEGPPYLRLEGFYPCPKPAFGTLTQDSLVPVPDYVFYQDQAEEIDALTARIGALSDALKLVGFYPAGPQGEGAPEIERALTPGFENKMISVRSWAVFTESGKGGAPIVWLPVEQVAAIMQQCILLRKQLVQDVYEIMGLSDIMRGATDPRETEGAQQLKAQYGGKRIRSRQKELARFCRDIVRLSAQVICSQFQPETVLAMANKKLPTQSEVDMAMMMAQQQGRAQNGKEPVTQEAVFGLLGNHAERLFRIGIENESTVIGDESQEKKDRTELIGAMTQFVASWGPLVQQAPMLAPLAGKLFTFGVRAFRVGRDLEETIEEVSSKLEEQAEAAARQPQQVDPKVQAEQIKAQSEVVKAQTAMAKSQAEIQSAQIEAESEAQNQVLGAQRDAFKAGMEAEKDQRKAAMEMFKLNAQRERMMAPKRDGAGRGV